MTLLTLLKATTGGGGVAVTYIDSTTTGNTAFVSSRAVPVPSGTAVDDVVVVRLSRWESINPAVTLPGGGTGWVTRTQVVNGSGKVDTYLKRLTAADSGTYTFSWTGTMWTTGQATLYRGVDPAADLSSNTTCPLTTATNSGTSFPNVTINSLPDGALDWHGFSESGGTHTVPTNWTEVEDNDSDVSGYRVTTAGSFTASGGTSSVSSANISSMLFLPASAGGGSAHTVDQTDSAGLADAAVLDRLNVLTDSAGLVDAPVLTQSKILTDSAGLTDTSLVELSKLVTQTDSVGLTDTALLSQSKIQTDSAGLTDTAALVQSKVSTDSTGLTDVSLIESGKAVGQTDSTGLTDGQVISQTHTYTDLAGLTDSTATAVGKVQTDSSGLTDIASVGMPRDIAPTDIVGLADATVLFRTAVLTDLVGLADAAAFSQLAALTDSVGLSDATDIGDGSGITPRPNEGTTSRPVVGTTSRPFSGITVRP